MTDLTFAIEAAKRGCQYVTLDWVDEISENADDLRPCFNPEPSQNQWQFMGEYDSECISKDMLSRFACGATLALWWEKHLHETVVVSDYPLCNRYAADARAFAKGE